MKKNFLSSFLFLLLCADTVCAQYVPRGVSGSSVRPPQIIVDAAGSGDYTTFTAALAAATSGQVVYGKKGTYTEKITIPAGITVRGDKGCVIKQPASDTGNTVTIAGADVLLEDIEIDGNYANQTNVVAQGQQCGIYLNAGAHRLRVNRVYLHDTYGDGIWSANGATDTTISDCKLTNYATSISSVSNIGGTIGTTTFPILPTTAAAFKNGDVVKFNTYGGTETPVQTGTVSSVTFYTSHVVSAASNLVFTVESGEGSKFATNDVIYATVGMTGTVGSVSGDTITMSSMSDSKIPQVGATVGRATMTMQSALGVTPINTQIIQLYRSQQSGAIYPRNAIMFYGSIDRPVVKGCYISGWMQAIGLWYGVRNALVQGNTLFSNFGNATGHRSAIELYQLGSLGSQRSHNQIVNNIIDGAGSMCIEAADGEYGTIYSMNTLTNSGTDVGANYGVLLFIGGSAGSLQEAISVVGNIFTAPLGGTGISINTYARGITISGNTFRTIGNAITSSQGASTVDVLPTITGNIFSNVYEAMLIVAQGATMTGGSFSNNTVLGSQNNACSISTNTVKGFTFSGNKIRTLGPAGINLNTGSTARITGNEIYADGGGSRAISVYSDCIIDGNFLQDTGDDGAGLVSFNDRNTITNNRITTYNSGSWSMFASGGNNRIYNNTFTNGQTAPTWAIRNIGNYTNNNSDPNSNGTTVTQLTPKLISAQTVGITQVTIAHGLGYTPTVVSVTMTSAGTIWRSAASDATNIYLTADAPARTCDVSVR